MTYFLDTAIQSWLVLVGDTFIWFILALLVVLTLVKVIIDELL